MGKCCMGKCRLTELYGQANLQLLICTVLLAFSCYVVMLSCLLLQETLKAAINTVDILLSVEAVQVQYLKTTGERAGEKNKEEGKRVKGNFISKFSEEQW